MDASLTERAAYLFRLSDAEGKGFINKRDMQRMRSEVPLSPEQLEAVFDSLDAPRHGFLTIDQFLHGFGEFLASGGSPEPPFSSDSEELCSIHSSEPTEESSGLSGLIISLQNTGLFSSLSIETLRHVCRSAERGWHHWDEAGSSLLHRFLTQLVRDAFALSDERSRLESSLRSRDEHHARQLSLLAAEFDKEESSRGSTKAPTSTHKWAQQPSPSSSALERYQLDALIEEARKARKDMRSAQERESALQTANTKLRLSKEELETKVQLQYEEINELKHEIDEIQKQEDTFLQDYFNEGFRLGQVKMLEKQGMLYQLRILKSITASLRKETSREPEKNQSFQQEYLCKRHKLKHRDSEPYLYDEDYREINPTHKTSLYYSVTPPEELTSLEEELSSLQTKH